MTLNERANAVADQVERDAARLRVSVSKVAGARVIDCGGAAQGSLAAGLTMARVCLADLGEVIYVPCPLAEVGGPAVQVTTDDPVRACLASQYAGWQVSVGKFFAMGSGPMRALAAREALFQHIGGDECPDAGRPHALQVHVQPQDMPATRMHVPHALSSSAPRRIISASRASDAATTRTSERARPLSRPTERG